MIDGTEFRLSASVALPSGTRPRDLPMDDVIVVGGGPAGCVAGMVMARAGLRVRLFERLAFPREKLCGDTLNPGAILALARIGVHPAGDGLPIYGMLVTGPGSARVEGWYPAGVIGRAIRRSVLDQRLMARPITPADRKSTRLNSSHSQISYG